MLRNVKGEKGIVTSVKSMLNHVRLHLQVQIPVVVYSYSNSAGVSSIQAVKLNIGGIYCEHPI